MKDEVLQKYNISVDRTRGAARRPHLWTAPDTSRQQKKGIHFVNSRLNIGS
jgi:hypothetical protein